MKIYLDNCSFNRPFDDQSSMRIKLEAEAKLFVQPKLSDSGNRVNLGQDMKELDHTVWHDIKKRGGICLDKLIKIL